VTESPFDAAQEAPAREALADAAARFADLAGSSDFTFEHGTIKLRVERDGWIPAHEALRTELPFFSWLAGVDWARDVAVGDPPVAEDLEDHYEVMSCLADVTVGASVILSVDLPKDDATLETLTPVYGGAEWHEREAHEMFGIDFRGHPNLVKLYLPDGFEGHPLRKSFPLLSREVKPWPGTVDVEDMPSTENPEAGDRS